MLAFVKRWAFMGGLLAVPLFAVLTVAITHGQLRLSRPVEPRPASDFEQRHGAPAAPYAATTAEPVAEPPAAASAAPAEADERDHAQVEHDHRAIAALRAMRALVAQGRIARSSMTSIEHLDARIEQLESGRAMPDPAGVQADPRARQRALELLAERR